MDKVDAYLRCAVSMGEYPCSKRLRAHVEAFFDGFELKEKRILDVGGGVGLLSIYAASRGADSICIEPEADGSTRGAAKRFSELASCAGVSARAELDVCTIQDHKPDGLYDIVIMANTINHIDESACINLTNDQKSYDSYVEVFKNIFDMTRNGGAIIITDCDRKNIFNTFGMQSPIVPSIEWHKHQHPLMWMQVLGDAGFDNARYKWVAPTRLGKFWKLFLENRISAYTLTGMFRITARKPI